MNVSWAVVHVLLLFEANVLLVIFVTIGHDVLTKIIESTAICFSSLICFILLTLCIFVMPASVADPVALVLRTALSGKKGPYSHETENAPELLEDRLAASAKRVLLSSIEYEPAPKQQLLSLDTLKSKYTVLNSSLSAKITSLNGTFYSKKFPFPY